MVVPADEVQQRVEKLATACRQVGVKLTHQRLEIFREVAGSVDHPDAETVFRGVRQRLPTVSLDTVYRTLWLLHDLGLVQTLGPRRESVRFDANPRRHHHYLCVRCGLTRDFESAELDALAVPPAACEFGSVLGTQVEVHGLCACCAAAADGPPREVPPPA
ncbi:MAG: transcriptional repressor [Fimbriimonadaceae bacterium]|nr:transcriptional repressor [Fimbriimonadaceae bacterium]